MTSHYDTLGVPKDADADTIKKAYRRKRGRGAHPDKGGNHHAMVALNRAYDTLSDPDKRARYDRTGEENAPPPPPLELKAQQAIMAIFDQLVEKADDYVDLIELVRVNIKNQQHMLRGSANQLRQKIKQAEKRRKRLKYTGTERNFLADLLDQRIGQMSVKAQEMEDETLVGDRALEMLKEFAYEAEQATAAPAHADYMNTIFKVIWNTSASG